MVKRKAFFEVGYVVHDTDDAHSSVTITEDGGDVWIIQGDGSEAANILVSKDMGYVIGNLLNVISHRK